MMLVL